MNLDLDKYVWDRMQSGSSFEEILEEHNITAEEAFHCLFIHGLIDEDLVERTMEL